MNYDRYPEIRIDGFEAYGHKEDIQAQLMPYKHKESFCMTVECYPGVDDEVLEMIKEAYDPEVIIRWRNTYSDDAASLNRR